ncbi:MAG TPA: cytochrome c oxidase subunit 3 [Chthoniobacteraceae bacterium]|jgi:cytochrome c oxidase subunit 3|nr:cytochrome c oxidase subunit 3 [Chthoniobacteraceae bacterium]
MSEDASSTIREQFETRSQQEEADSLGIWTFLSTEILFFGGLFLCYTVYRTHYHAGFVEGSKHLYYSIGTINTFVLLTSSLFMALAVHSIQDGDRKKLRLFLLLTFAFGATFLGLKLCEYYLDYREHLVPAVNFRPGDFSHAASAEIFLFLYFAMTGLHAIHMTIGLSALTYLYLRARKDEFSTEYHSPVRVVGLYWHFVDIVWVFLYPMLYLVTN